MYDLQDYSIKELKEIEKAQKILRKYLLDNEDLTYEIEEEYKKRGV